VKGLSMLARSGSFASGLALVEALPLIEDAGDWAAVPHRDLLEREFRSLPPGTGSLWLRELSRHRLSVQRKLLVGAGLTGNPEVTQGLLAAIGHSSLRRAALVGLAVLGDRRAARAVGEVLRLDDRSARRGALAALVALGGDEAGRFLSRSLGRSSDRKTVMQLLGDKAGSWAQNVYLDGLPYRDIRESCIAGLRRLSDGRGPEDDSLESWRTWLGLPSDAAPKPGAG
jgi:hypothetical protein